MAHASPSERCREGIGLIELAEMFPDELSAERWFEVVRWPSPEDRRCPKCGSVNTAPKANRKPLPYRCRDCRKFFSVRHGSVMEGSKIPLRKWAFAVCLNAASREGVSSVRLHRELHITQKSAWLMAHRLREAFTANPDCLLAARN